MIKLGSNNMVGAYLGDAPISKIYLGDVLVYGGGAEPTYTVRYTYVNGEYDDIVYEDGIAKADCTDVEDLVEVEVGEGITKLADDFVRGCDNLATVSLPSTLTEIGLRAFRGCSDLTLINLPSSVETIGDEAFANCTSLNYFYLNSTPTFELGSSQSPKGAFSGCSDIDFYLSGMTSDEMERWLISETESGYVVSEFLYGQREETVSVFKSTVVMHCSNGSGTLNQMVAYVKDGEVYADLFSDGKIPNAKYRGTTITEVEIGEAITIIGGSAFMSCKSLSSVTIPNSVTSIGTSVFYQCISLTSVDIPNSVTSIGSSVFSSCTSLTSVTIPNSVTSIGSSAFMSCISLTSVDIPNSVTSIGSSAFMNCSSLSSITCNATTAPTIVNTTFRMVKTNGTLYYPSGSDYSQWLSTDSYYLGYYGWSRGEQGVGENIVARFGKNGTVMYYINDLWNDSFEQFVSKVSAIKIDGGEEIPIEDTYHIVEDETKTYQLVGSDPILIDISTLNYTEHWQNVDDEIVLYDSDSEIGFRFKNYIQMDNSIRITNNDGQEFIIQRQDLYSIDEGYEDEIYYNGVYYNVMFYYDENTYDMLFRIRRSDENEMNLIFKYNDEELYDDVFVTKVTYYSIDYQVQSGQTVEYIVTDNDSEIDIRVLDEKVEKLTIGSKVASVYRSDNLGSTSNQDCLSTLIIDRANIGQYAFAGKNNLTSITFLNDITSIGVNAFTNCENLTSFEFPSGLTSIGNYAFSYCTSLTSVTIPSGVTIINESAFEKCTSLTSVTIPSGVTKIGNSAFRSCSAITSIELPSTVNRVEEWAFANCTNLSTIICNSTTAPILNSNWASKNFFNNIARNGTLYYPQGSAANYNIKWLSSGAHYLGYYGWSGQEIVDANEIVDGGGGDQELD